jgi:predicted RNA binding protein YcfA (HicA-like mRNA interferase family)
MKSMPTTELRKLLRGLGCEYIGTVGSHEKWTTPGGRSTVLKAAVKEQAPGTLRNIQAALAAEFGPDWIEKRRRR